MTAASPQHAAPKIPPRTPRFIVDTPATSDELSPHQRIANSVVEVLHEDERIKLIGLLGGWGSGKSTVVKLVEKALERRDAPTMRCFSFDAWEHQSDPPRRAFLEALAFFLRTDEGFPHLADREKAWRKKLDGLNRQREKRRIRNTPVLTGPGAWYLISLIAMTAGLRMIGDGTLSETDQRDVWACVVFVAGWVLTACPLLVFLATWIVWRRTWRPTFRWSWSWFVEHKEERKNDSLLAVFANRPIDERKELTLRSPEPSAMEFQSVFRQFVHEALRPDEKATAPQKTETEKNRFVVIIDNLDRLPPDEAMIIWSTVRSLFLGSDHGQPIKRDRLPTVIMPIDDVALRRIYKDKTDVDGALAQSFIDKTFDLVFHVPQPVLSRWHGYLRKRLMDVFDAEVEGDWPHAIASAYETWLARPAPDGKDPPAVPTPREINALVNAIAVLWMQRRDDPIPMEMIAYYAVWRREIGDLHHHLKAAEDDGRRFTESQKLQLAALTYGVNLEDAAELFLEEPLRLAIETRDSERFAPLVKFDRHFLRFLQGAAMSEHGLQAWYAAEMLDGLPDLPEAWARDSWTALRTLAIQRTATERARPIDIAGLDALVAHAGTDAKPFIQAVRYAMSELRSSAIEGDKVVEYAIFARRLVEHAEQAGLADFDIKLPGAVTQYTNMLRQDVPIDALRILIPRADTLNKVVEAFSVETSSSPSRQDIADSVARLIARGPDDLNWTPVISVLAEIINNRRADAMADAVRTIFNLYVGPPEPHSAVTQMGLEGLIDVAHAWLWSQSQDLDALATATALLLRMNRHVPQGDHRSWQDRLNEHPDLVGLIHRRLALSGFLPNLAWAITRHESWPDEAPLLRALIAIWVDNMEVDPGGVFNKPDVVNLLVSLDALPAFWRRMSADPDFWDLLARLDINRAAPIYRALQRAEGRQSRVMRALSKRFRSTPEGDWARAIETAQEPYGLATELPPPSARSTNAGPTAADALIASAAAMLARDDDAYRIRWFELARKLSPALRETLHRRVALEMVSTALSGRRIRDLFVAGGPLLLREGDFVAHADRVVAQLVIPMLADDLGLTWAVAQADSIRDWVRASKPVTKAAFREQLVSKVIQNNSEARQLGVALGWARSDLTES